MRSCTAQEIEANEKRNAALRGNRFRLRGGSLKFKDKDGAWVRANPGDPMYSTVIMFATHMWDADAGRWVPVPKA